MKVEIYDSHASTMSATLRRFDLESLVSNTLLSANKDQTCYSMR